MKLFIKFMLVFGLLTSFAFAKGSVVVDVSLTPAGSFQAKSKLENYGHF